MQTIVAVAADQRTERAQGVHRFPYKNSGTAVHDS